MPWSFAVPYYGILPNYTPNVAKPPSVGSGQGPIPEARLKLARPLDGLTIYRQQYGIWQEADWLGFEWGAWWEIDGQPPTDKVKL